MADKEQLKDEQTENVTGGLSFGEDPNFERVTELLKEAGDRAWAALGYKNILWKHIFNIFKITINIIIHCHFIVIKHIKTLLI